MASEQEERRRTPRHDVRIAACVAAERQLLFPCIILDINDFGARIEVRDGEVPDELYLIDAAAIVGYRARVQWRQAPMVGTRFLQSWDIAALSTPLWLQAMRAEATVMLGAQRGIRLVT
jgi:hypothetical protein